MKKTNPIILICFFAFLMSFSHKISAQQNTQNNPGAKGAVLFDIPGTDDVIIKKDIEYISVGGSALNMDIYYPPDFDFKSKIPAIIIVLGYNDMAGQRLLGSKFKDYITFISWCKIIAASGMAAVLYETVNPVQDILALANYLKSNEGELGIDNSKIGAFTLSAHSPTTICETLTGQSNIFKCAVVYYGLILTDDFVYLPQIDAFSQDMGFCTPRLPDPALWKKNVPIMIVRAGLENIPYINQSLTEFCEKALFQNLPITLVNYSDGTHGFDTSIDNDKTRQIIKNTLDFWKFNLNQCSN
jgi:dienelactone hydrolase